MKELMSCNETSVPHAEASDRNVYPTPELLVLYILQLYLTETVGLRMHSGCTNKLMRLDLLAYEELQLWG